MKQLFILLLILPFLGISQSEKSITPVASGPALATTGIIRAVIVGISDYEDPAIRDLRFAHRDAEIFAEYLRSSAGGKVPENNIRLLTNKQATLSAIDDALNWLRDESRAGDMAIIYFSGHGDVEKQTLWQLGYLLTYNTWGNNYRNRAERIEDLNDIVISLSTVKNSRVIVILDACRSGKLASEANRGTVLTAEQMGKRVANEVRIMSCQPDQLSLEDPSCGGGRGLFSYYLVNGLKGLADEEKDQLVTLAADVAREKLKTAEYEGLLKFLELGRKSSAEPNLRAGFSRSIAVQLNDRAQHTINLYLRGDAGELAKRYYTTQAQIYARNPQYLKAAMRLIEPTHPLHKRLNLNFLYLDGVGERLLAGMSEYPKKGLETALKKQRKALALDDKAPYIHNELGLIYMQMKDYKKAMALNDKHFIPFQQLGYLLTETTRYEEAEAMFRKAEELKNGALLDSDGDGVIDELDQEFNPTVGIQKTLYLLSNPKTVEDYMTNGLSYFINYNYKSAEQSFRKVMEMDPNHLEVYDYLGQITFIEKRYEEAELFFQKLIKLRPAEPMLRFKLADVYSAQNRWTESEKIYYEALQNDSISKEVKVEAYRKLINLFGKEHRYLDQERALWEITRQYKEKSDINQLENFYLAMLKVFPNNADWLYKQGAFYAEVKKDESKAVYGFEKLTSLDTNYSSRVYLHTRIGEYYQSTDPEKALSNLQKALDIKLDTVLGLYALLGKSAMLNQQPAAAIEAYQKEYALSDRSAELAYTIGRLYTGTGQKTEALEWLGCAFEAGFKNELVLKYDREWDAFRESTAWKALRKE